MPQNVVLLGDKTLSLLARNLNSQLQPLGSRWNVVDAGYDTWLVAPLDPAGALFDKDVAVWAFVLSPRVLDNVPDIGARVDATLERLAQLTSPRPCCSPISSLTRWSRCRCQITWSGMR